MWRNAVTGSLMDLDDIEVYLYEVFNGYSFKAEALKYLEDNHYSDVSPEKVAQTEVAERQWYVEDTLGTIRCCEIEKGDNLQLFCDFDAEELREVIWE